MTTIGQRLKHWGWRQWTLTAFAGLYLLYVGLSYLYLPGKLQDLVQTNASQLLGRDVRVQRISFNPFTLAITAEQFSIADQPNRPLLAWKTLYVNFDAWGSLFGRQIRLSLVKLEDPHIAIERRKSDFNFTSIAERLSSGGSHPSSSKSKSAIALMIDDIQILKGGFTFDDVSGTKPAHSGIEDMTADVKNLYIATGDNELKPLTFQAAMSLGGQLSISGDYRADPFKVIVKIKADDIHLEALKDFIANQVAVQLNKGRLSVQADLEAKLDNGLQVVVQNGQIGVNDLIVDDDKQAPLLGLKQFQLQDISMNLAKRAVTINKVTVDEPDIALAMDANKQMNLTNIMKQPEDGAKQEDKQKVKQEAKQEVKQKEKQKAPSDTKLSTTAQPWQFVVHQVTVNNGTARFHDASIKPNFKSALNSINLTLDNLTNVGEKPANFELTSRVDKYAPLTIKGSLVPLQLQPGMVIACQLRGLEMPTFSPYSGTYLGNNVRSGQLTLNLHYEIKQKELTGENSIVAKQLYLGDPVQSKQATSLPVSLGLALLRDANGVIDLNLGVSGDLNDPKFSISGIVWKALVNVFTKAVSSPFKLLASLVGSKEDLGSITFKAGDSVLDDDSQQRLAKLAKALLLRPQLVVTVHGSANTVDDNAMLQRQRVLQSIASLRKMHVTDLQFASLLDDKANLSSLEKLNTKLKLPTEKERQQALKKANSQLQGDALKLAAYQQMLEDVTGKQTITQQDLLGLADQRALAIKQYLVGVTKVGVDRVALEKTHVKDLKGRICSLGVKAL